MDKFFEALANNIIVLGAFMVPIGIVAVNSYFSHRRLELIHRERMAAIEKGLPPIGDLPDPHKEDRKEEEGAKTPPDYLKRGLFWLCPGGGMVLFSLIAMEDLMSAIRLPILGVSVICAGVGAAYVAMYFVEQDRRRGAGYRPGLQ
jgi:purine-cytosine permease-like protein